MLRLLTSLILTSLSFSSFAFNVSMRDVPITEFVRWYSQVTNTPILAPNTEQRITVYSGDVDDADIDSFFSSVLSVNGLYLVSGNPAYISTNAPALANPSDSSSSDYLPKTSFFENSNNETSLFEVSNISPDDLVRPIQLFLSSYGSGSNNVYSLPKISSLVVSYDPKIKDKLISFINSVDVYSPQVMIEGVIFEVSSDKNSDFGFSYKANSHHSDSASSIVSDISSGSFSLGLYPFSSLNILFSALDKNASTKVLSQPRVLVRSSSKAVISVGQNVPFITGQSVSQSGERFNTIERHDVGTSLTVSPLIKKNGHVILDFSTTADAVSSSSVASDVITNQRKLSTVVEVTPGKTLLIGGLTSNQNQSSNGSVPFFSSIPLIGSLFTSRTDSDSKTTLYVALRLTVIEP